MYFTNGVHPLIRHGFRDVFGGHAIVNVAERAATALLSPVRLPTVAAIERKV